MYKIVKFKAEQLGNKELHGLVMRENKRYTYVYVTGVPVDIRVPNKDITVVKVLEEV
jgi:hypothetical protein